MDCKHSDWLHVVAPSTLQDFNRLQALITCGAFPDPEHQAPSMITFVGGTAKTRALNKLLGRKHERCGTRADVAVHVYPGTHSTSSPTLIADFALSPRAPVVPAFSGTPCHEIITRPLAVPDTGAKKLKEIVLSKLFGPFTDILCIFMSDFGGLENIVTLLATWIAQNTLDRANPRFYPQLMLLMEKPAVPAHRDSITAQILRELLASKHLDPSTCFSRLDVLCMPSFTRGSLVKYLFPILDDTRSARRQVQALFSMTHFATLFKYACDNMSKSMEPLNFISASRLQNPVPASFGSHIYRFFSSFTSSIAIYKCAVPLVASSLVLDAAPPGMHLYDSRMVFQTLYKEQCKIAMYRFLPQEAPRLLGELELNFIKMMKHIGESQISSAANHGQLLEIHRPTIKQFRTRRPDKGLVCGHLLCETCIQIFGRSRADEPHTFYVDNCIICGADTQCFMVRLKPPSAGIRILSVDGGGVRGVIPLQALQELESAIGNRIGYTIPIQENFDLAFGTSSGGLIILGLFLNGWSVSHCLKQFLSLAKNAFHPRKLFVPFMRKLADIIVAFITDSRYNARGLESVLQETFGESRSMLDWSTKQYSTKIAVTATTVNGTLPCLFSNYGSSDQARAIDCGYTVEGPKEGGRGILVWEAFYPPKCVPSLGIFQDGGLKHNNPSGIAIWESKFLWPQSAENNLDIIVSMGTGTASGSTGSDTGTGETLRRFIPRLYHSFISSLDGQKIWTELYNHMPGSASDKYFRFNVHFDGKEPEIDDLDAMFKLKDGNFPNSNLLVNKETESEVA
ncbi:acyl transferase/acyl hydrolase/lysophospholipase [Sphaerosporella brunnea]|uniref:Acyl transferase/acyl hydrolase/lysophospholipase n=1 Tax=Sphaerosporella brunnea TaxID=1250544 RepID=A0A5J5EJS5_9PEZI|nr:acyl transferase/acyl hydrolase/lysophospholipase [Sphaerosporella brunnea]